MDVALARAVRAPGRYRIAFDGPLHDAAPLGEVPRPRDRLRPVPLACASVEIELVAR